MSDNAKRALFILRVCLGGFLLLWGIDKLVAPETTVQIFTLFYKVPISVAVAKCIGIAEILFALVFIAGIKRRLVFGLGLAIHAVSTISTYKQLVSPFGPNHLFIAGIPVLAAFYLLYVMAEEDTCWSISL